MALICPECESEVYGDVCKECGLVIEENPIVNIPERIVRDDMTTENQNEGWSWKYSDIGDSTIHSKKTTNPELKRAFKRENVDDGVFGRRYLNGYYEIKRICGIMGLGSNIFNTAVYILRLLMKTDYFSGNRKKFANFMALVIVGARLNKLPVRYEEIYEYTSESPKSIKSAYKHLIKYLELDIPNFTLSEYVNYHCNVLGLNYIIRQKCCELAKLVEEKMHISGKGPIGFSAAIIRIVSGLQRKDISEKLYISEPVITWRYNEIERFMG